VTPDRIVSTVVIVGLCAFPVWAACEALVGWWRGRRTLRFEERCAAEAAALVGSRDMDQALRELLWDAGRYYGGPFYHGVHGGWVAVPADDLMSLADELSEDDR